MIGHIYLQLTKEDALRLRLSSEDLSHTCLTFHPGPSQATLVKANELKTSLSVDWNLYAQIFINLALIWKNEEHFLTKQIC